MYQFLYVVQESISNLVNYWNALPEGQRAAASFIGGVVMIAMCIKDRNVEYASVAMGLGAILALAYALSIGFNLL